jgi:predicted O-methyltransferase YrrM
LLSQLDTAKTFPTAEGGKRDISGSELARYSTEIAVFQQMVQVKTFSMLHLEVLLMLRRLAMSTSDAVIEIGPYVGGSTVAMAMGIKACSAAKLISVERGGSYPQHPHIPSEDILGDLRNNLTNCNLLDQVDIIEGRSSEPTTRGKIIHALGGRRIGLLFIDADGKVERDLTFFRPYLAPDAYIVLDDYITDQAKEKSCLINPFVDRAVAEGWLEQFGVYGWGTWFGRYRA